MISQVRALNSRHRTFCSGYRELVRTENVMTKEINKQGKEKKTLKITEEKKNN